MNKSETTVTIFKAISAAQGDFKTVEKTSNNFNAPPLENISMDEALDLYQSEISQYS